MSYVVLVRSHSEEERLFGPFRSHDRALKLAQELRAFIDERDAETPAYAYALYMQSPSEADATFLKGWMANS